MKRAEQGKRKGIRNEVHVVLPIVNGGRVGGEEQGGMSRCVD